jgi:hypothetical protein
MDWPQPAFRDISRDRDQGADGKIGKLLGGGALCSTVDSIIGVDQARESRLATSRISMDSAKTRHHRRSAARHRTVRRVGRRITRLSPRPPAPCNLDATTKQTLVIPNEEGRSRSNLITSISRMATSSKRRLYRRWKSGAPRYFGDKGVQELRLSRQRIQEVYRCKASASTTNISVIVRQMLQRCIVEPGDTSLPGEQSIRSIWTGPTPRRSQPGSRRQGRRSSLGSQGVFADALIYLGCLLSGRPGVTEAAVNGSRKEG